MSNYEEVKQVLTEMLEDLNDRLVKITDDVKHTHEPLEQDFAEQVVQHENDEVLDYLGNSARKEIELIKDALVKINSGDYGICQICGDSIGAERLKIIPYSSKCVACASLKD